MEFVAVPAGADQYAVRLRRLVGFRRFPALLSRIDARWLAVDRRAVFLFQRVRGISRLSFYSILRRREVLHRELSNTRLVWRSVLGDEAHGEAIRCSLTPKPPQVPACVLREFR